MQDNDPKHAQSVLKNGSRFENPDLNPIENMWAHAEKKLGEKNHKNLNELWQHIQDIWCKIPVDMCCSYIESMSKRCTEVLKSNGCPINC